MKLITCTGTCILKFGQQQLIAVRALTGKIDCMTPRSNFTRKSSNVARRRRDTHNCAKTPHYMAVAQLGVRVQSKTGREATSTCHQQITNLELKDLERLEPRELFTGERPLPRLPFLLLDPDDFDTVLELEEDGLLDDFDLESHFEEEDFELPFLGGEGDRLGLEMRWTHTTILLGEKHDGQTSGRKLTSLLC